MRNYSVIVKVQLDNGVKVTYTMEIAALHAAEALAKFFHENPGINQTKTYYVHAEDYR